MTGSLLLALAACHQPELAPPDPADLGECGTEVGYTPRVVRLTHAQYDNSVRDTLGIDTHPSENFLADPKFGGFDNNAQSLITTDRLARDYRRAAEDIGESLATTHGAVEALAPCDPGPDPDACARQFITSVGAHVYRRPLTSDEVDKYVAAYGQANGLYASGSPFEQGMALVIEAMLQSPYFLYRLELSSPKDDSGVVVLNGYEVATRLSYLLWNAPPDQELLDAAADGSLDSTEGVSAEADRMIADAKVGDMVDDFHSQLLAVDKYEDLSRSPDLFPAFDPSYGPEMEQEALDFTRHVVLDEDGTYEDLLTEPAGFVNRDLAPLYGLDPNAFGADLQYTPLDPTQRSGLLTLSGFLAANAYYDIDNPIFRGVFVHRNLLCTDLPDPPGNADLKLPPINGGTTREIVEQHTADPACQVCHGIINPAGFAFEHYDAVGQWRDEENGHPVDTTGTIPVQGGDSITFTDAIDLSHQIARHPAAHKCYLTNWFRYGYARTETDADQCTLERLDQQASSDDYNLRDLISGLAKIDTFRFRPSAEETP